MDWQSWGGTHVGKVRKINEDAVLELPEQLLWSVADGMGGHSGGNLASALIVEHLGKYINTEQLGINIRRVVNTLENVNQALIEHAKMKLEQASIIGSTVAVLIAHKNHNVCLWAGDSRIYRYRHGILKLLTRDHTPAADMAEFNRTTNLPTLNVSSQAISRAVGAADKLFIDSQIQETHSEDLYLLCSDGLNKELTDAEISNVFEEYKVEDCARILLKIALDRGGRDNISVLVVEARASEKKR